MSWGVIAMFAVGVLLVLTGIGLLLALTRPSGPAKVYVFRMVGIMTIAAGALLAISAGVIQSWGPGR